MYRIALINNLFIFSHQEIKTQLEGAIGETIRELQRQRSETKSESGSTGRRTSESSLGMGDVSRKASVSPEKDDGRKQSNAVNGTLKPTKDKLIEVEKAETGSVSIFDKFICISFLGVILG